MYHETIESNEDFINYNVEPGSDKVKIFGYYFVKNNEDKLKIIYEAKEYDSIEYFKAEEHKKTLQIKLIKKKILYINQRYILYV